MTSWHILVLEDIDPCDHICLPSIINTQQNSDKLSCRLSSVETFERSDRIRDLVFLMLVPTGIGPAMYHTSLRLIPTTTKAKQKWLVVEKADLCLACNLQ